MPILAGLMNTNRLHLRALGLHFLLTLLTATSLAENFVINIGDVILDGSPGPGAGRIDVNPDDDIYTFSATSGQSIFVEEIGVSTTFGGWLRWELKSPGGTSMFSSYLNNSNEGRRTLPETGTYTLRVWVGAANPAYTGTYSFRLRPIPADPTFPIQPGDTIANGVPAAGAGSIEVPGAWDFYTFEATAGQLVFFETLGVDAAFQGNLYCELKSPSSNAVFSSYLTSGNHPGRRTLPESGTYRLKVFAQANGTNHVGSYSLRVRPVPSDQTFAIQPGDTVMDNSPLPGAGRIEVPGAQDLYTFHGVAGQSVFFEGISAAAEFAGWLQWEVKSPSGQSLFRSFFGNVGRKTLPETGTYTMRFWVGANNPDYVGTYSFRLSSPSGDAQHAIELGVPVADGSPGAGAGQIEAAGGQDFYTFEGLAGQRVVFETLAADASFGGWLRWEAKTPGGSNWFSIYFKPGTTEVRTLPESGTYSIRVYDGTTDPQHVGAYSFRLHCDVLAGRDNLSTLPSTPLSVPINKLLCNDTHEVGDLLEVDLPSGTSTQGGTVTTNATGIVYTPRAGFVGTDTFEYRLRGRFGGEDSAVVTVRVGAGADQVATAVSVVREGPTSVVVCLLGAPNQTYQVDQSDDLLTWSSTGMLTADDTGSMTYQYSIETSASRRFHRFRKP